jgi:hypothetical protein
MRAVVAVALLRVALLLREPDPHNAEFGGDIVEGFVGRAPHTPGGHG